MEANQPSYTIVDLEQGSSAWLEWRRGGIGASDAPAIMGENPWKTVANLLEEKYSGQPIPQNAAMKRGIELEPVARQRYEAQVGIRVAPACLQSVKHEWLRASVDGLAAIESAVVEIKCGEGIYRKASATQSVPSYYYGQLQHILAVTDYSWIDFYCYWPEQPEVHLRVARNEPYIERLLDAEYQFWQRMLERRGQAGASGGRV